MNRASWVAIDASTDRRGRARALARIHRQVIEGAEPPATLRRPIADSWRRCARAGVDPADGLAPLSLSAEEAAERWRAHPLSIAEGVLRELLADVRAEDGQLVLACDAGGALLWIDGDRAQRAAAHRIHLEPGAVWTEAAAGTNAMGTALAVDHPIQVFAAEHFAAAAHDWTCSAAPVHDPLTGELLGVIDLSGPASTAHPHSLALVEAAARMIEIELEAHHRHRARTDQRTSTLVPHAQPAPPRDADRAPLRVEALGRNRARVADPAGWTELSRRHSEIVVLLTLFPDGLDAAELADQLYGDYGLPVSARAEISRLRRILGDRLPRGGHRLDGPVDADFAAAERLADVGQVATALELYPGPLLPASVVPLVIEARERLELRLRDAAIDSGDSSMLDRWLATPSGRDDIEASRALVKMLTAGDPRRPAAESRLRRLSRGQRHAAATIEVEHA